MSVDLQNAIEQAGLDARTYVTTQRWLGSIRFQAGRVRRQEFQVGASPIVGRDDIEDNPYHGEIWGTFNRRQQKALRQMSEWFVRINGVAI